MATRMSVEAKVPFAAVVSHVYTALRRQGFLVCARLDVQQMLRQHLMACTAPHLVLTAWNPVLVHRGLSVEPRASGLLLCHVVIREIDGCTAVDALEPTSVAESTRAPQLAAIAEEAARRLCKALDKLRLRLAR